MTKAELRLELIRIAHSNGRLAPATLQMVYEYEKAFDGLLESETEPAAQSDAAPSRTKKA